MLRRGGVLVHHRDGVAPVVFYDCIAVDELIVPGY